MRHGTRRAFLTLLLTFGLSLVILNALQWIFTADDRTIDTTYASQSFAVGVVNIPMEGSRPASWRC